MDYVVIDPLVNWEFSKYLHFTIQFEPEFDSLIFMLKDCFHIRWHNK